MSVFDSPLSLDQEVLARGKRGKITGVMFTAAGLCYRVAFPLVSGDVIGFIDEQMFSAVDVTAVPQDTPAPSGMEFLLCRLDTCRGNSYYASQEDFINSADAMLREKRPYHGYEWNATRGRYVLTHIANHPYPQP